MKNPLKAMGCFISTAGDSISDVSPMYAGVAKVLAVPFAPIVGIAAIFQKSEKKASE